MGVGWTADRPHRRRFPARGVKGEEEASGRSSLLRMPDGRLRAGWRIVIWLIAVIITAALVNRFLLSSALIARAGALSLSLFALSLLAWHWLDHRGPAATPLALTRTNTLRASWGFVLGLAVVAGIVALLAAAGSVVFEKRVCDAGQAGSYLGRTLVLFLLAATAEELLFRGYGLFTLRDGIGGMASVLVTAVLFCLVHSANPHYNAGAAANLALVGIVLGVWILRVGSVWGAIGLHTGWNWSLGAGAALPVSGLRFSAPCYVGRLEGPSWMTGGSFGLEASLLTTVAWLMIGALIWRRTTFNG